MRKSTKRPKAKEASTAEELKGRMREYAELHFPDWSYALLTIRVGDITSQKAETLLILSPATKAAAGRWRKGGTRS